MPRELVFAAAIAVPLEAVPNAVRLAALLMISSGERAALAVAPLALITVSSCLGPSPTRSTRCRFAPTAISTSSSQVGMGEVAGDGMFCFVG
jgi:hypothetical protein